MQSKYATRATHCTEILLVGRAGELILQQRDNRLGTANPGLVTTFGGGLEPGEAALDAAYRILLEETSLDIAKERFVYYGEYQRTENIHGGDWTITFFVVKDVDYEDMKVLDGGRYVVVRDRDELGKHNTSKLFKELAEDWYSGWRDFLLMPNPPSHVVDEVVREMSKNLKSIDATSNPIVFCPVGLVGSGKTSTLSAVLKMSKTPYYQISSDRIRTAFYDRGYNFQLIISTAVERLVDLAIEKQVNILIDSNVGSKIDLARRIERAGYRVMVFHIDPSENYIIRKLEKKSWDSVPEELRFTFFKLPRHVLAAYQFSKNHSKVVNSLFLREYPPDFEIDPEFLKPKMIEDISNNIINKMREHSKT